MQSKQQLINRALQELGVLAAGQTAEAEDVAVISDAIPPVMSDLATRDIWTWGDPDQYDDDASDHLAVLLANSRAKVFGAEPSEQTRLLAEGRLRQLRLAILSGSRQTSEYF